MSTNNAELSSHLIVPVFNLDPSMIGMKIGGFTIEKRTEMDSVGGALGNIYRKSIEKLESDHQDHISSYTGGTYIITLEQSQQGLHLNGPAMKKMINALHFFKPSDFFTGNYYCVSDCGGICSHEPASYNKTKIPLTIKPSEIKEFNDFFNSVPIIDETSKDGPNGPKKISMMELYDSSLRVSSIHLKFIQYIFILELAAMSPYEMRYHVSRNIALLLGKSIEECEKIELDIKRLYDLRSAYVHSANKKITNDDLILARSYACRSIKKILELGEVENLSRAYTNSGYGSFKFK